jgi:hypothetical protein
MLDKFPLPAELTPFTVTVRAQRLCEFAKGTGQADRVYLDDAAARAAGHRSIPVPPTFLFCMEMESPNPLEIYERLGIDFSTVLHGEQEFVYHQLAYAGDRLHFSPKIVDTYEKQGGALRFVVWETRVETEARQAIADLKSVMVACRRETE